MDQLDQQAFDLVINATASGISGEIPALPAGVVNVQTRCYDMFYQQGVTPFWLWAQQRGQPNMPMGWVCWWGRRRMLSCFGTE